METYEILKMLAIKKRIPLKAVLRDILTEYAKKLKEDIEKEIYKDPIWKGIGLLDIEDTKASERDDWGVVEWRSK